MKTIDDLLREIEEDKKDNLSTTSFLFKRDLWDFFQGFNKKNCVEFGTHKGQTTRILSHLFNKVYTINLPDHFDAAILLNADRSNIEYVPMNLYTQSIYENFEQLPVSMCFIDAVHTFDTVMADFVRCTNLVLDKEVYIVFDDYGAYKEVWSAVNQLITAKQISVVKYIGHPTKHSFGGDPERILNDYEGIICKLIQ